MKKLLLLTLLFSNALLAQELTVGPTYEDAFDHYAPQVIGENDSLLFVVDLDPVDIVFESYRKSDLSRELYTKLKAKIRYKIPRPNFLLHMFYVDGYFVYFTENIDVKTAISELHMHRVNVLTGKKETDEIIISQTVSLASLASGRVPINQLGNYDIASSQSGKRTAVVFSFVNYETQRIYEYIFVYDNDLRKIKTKQFIRASFENTIQGEIIIDEEANIYYLAGNELVFLEYFTDYEEWREPLPTEGLALNGNLFLQKPEFREDGNMVSVLEHLTTDIRTYKGNKNKKDRKEGDTQIEGLMFVEMNTLNKETKVARMNAIPEKVLKEIRTIKDRQERWDAEMNNEYYYSWHFTPNQDILVGEVSPTPDNDERNYGNIIVFSFGHNGQINWSSTIRKDQNPSFSEGNVSYTA
jgi:hypothetical protein